MQRRIVTIDGNQAAAHVAYHLNEVCAIYPITPSSPMGEWADSWASQGKKNLWGTVPEVVEMQSEGGASGAVHGALQSGALTTTFTASQGLLLMVPNMFKIAGELTPAVFHVAARSVAAQALSIFGDHSDVYTARGTGWAFLASGSIQEVMDNALIAQAAALRAKLPFLHFFDGFRTSHELQKVEELNVEDMRALVPHELVRAFRERALTPDSPVIRGTAQNPDAFFQARESVNKYYDACPAIVQEVMDLFAKQVGRQYKLFDYVGAPDAEKVIILMGSGAEAAHEAVENMVAGGEKVGMVKVRLFRPFSAKHFIESMPESVRSVAVLDRTKEPGSVGDPLFLDVNAVLAEARQTGAIAPGFATTVTGGRYGLSSKEFTPAMVKGIFQELDKDQPKRSFSVGIVDDVTHKNLDWDPEFSTEENDVFRAMFYGLGSDGTVGANKNSIKIIGEGTDKFVQAYFVYDSKKAGATTVSHLRFGDRQIRSTYLIDKAHFLACHQPQFLENQDILEKLMDGGTFLLNSPLPKDEIWDSLPEVTQKRLLEKKAKFYVIDAASVAEAAGMGRRINTVMQTCFFAVSGVLPRDEAIASIKKAIEKTYGSKGRSIVAKNIAAVDSSIEHMVEISLEGKTVGSKSLTPFVPADAPDFIKDVTGVLMSGKGDTLPVSAFPDDGTYPTGTTQYAKLSLATEIPSWDEALCIQCAKCAIVCPHAAIRVKVADEEAVKGAPETFKTVKTRGKDFGDSSVMSIQVAPDDCTGCGICVEVCPAKDKSNVKHKALDMVDAEPLKPAERENYDFFLDLPEYDRTALKVDTVKGSQILQPLFEYSGACLGCGETPYIKLATQLFGDRMLVANATGCSSIYGGNLPTHPYAKNSVGRGPTWSNSLFEDNAEFGMGFRVTVDKHTEQASRLLGELKDKVGAELADSILGSAQEDEAEIFAQRERVENLKAKLESLGDDERAKDLLSLADYLSKKSVWIVGGDGWAYDIGYGGLDHVLASGRNVNVLVLDTEVYSNTGGQASKATPIGAVAKFAAGGKPTGKKDLGMMAMSYGNVYVAQVAMGAKDSHTVKAFLEAEAYPGPSLIIAYSHCIAHGINMRHGLTHQKEAVECGHWPLFRYHPDKAAQGENPFSLDSKAPKLPIAKYMESETRYRMLELSDPEAAARFRKQAQHDVEARYQHLSQLAKLDYSADKEEVEV